MRQAAERDPGGLIESAVTKLNCETQRAQVIVLTCTPDRFRHIGDATVIRL